MDIKDSNQYKISIIEDSAIHKEWLKTEIHDNAKLTVISSDRSGRNGLDSVKTYNPHLVLIDFQLEDMTGLEVAKRIKYLDSRIKIFMLTAHTEISIIERIINDKNIDALSIKGSKYFETTLLSALIHVIEGETYLDPSLLKKIRDSKNSNELTNLTKREFEIFMQSKSGKTDNRIAEDLNVELSHIKNLKSRVTKKIERKKIDTIELMIIENSFPDRNKSL